MPVVNREGFTVTVLRTGSSSGAGLGLLLTARYVVTCAHVVNAALGRALLAQDEPSESTLIQVEFTLLGDSAGGPVRSCAIRRWVPPPLSGVLGGDVAVLEIGRGDLPPSAGAARAVDPAVIRGMFAETFGYPANPDRRRAGAWTRHVLRGRVGNGVLQLDSSNESAITAQPGYSGSPVVVTEGGSDAVVGILSVAAHQARDAYAIPISGLADVWPDAFGHVLMPSCPYRGLSAFTQADAQQGLFVGREHDVAELRSLVDRESVVVVTGSSGVGKSSLLAAGLATALNDDGWGVASVLPGITPLEALGAALLKLEDPSSRRTVRALRGYARRLRAEGLAGLGAKIALIAGKPILVCVDPLDEIFNDDLCPPRLRSEFLEIVLSAAGSTPGRVHVACALRSDLISELLNHPDAASRLQGRLYMLSPLGHDRIKRVVEEPALKRGVRYDEGLVSIIADDAGSDGSLPLLEFTLAELWPYQRQHLIKLDDYVRLGRVSGALSRHAELAFQLIASEFGEDEIRRVLLAFVVAGPSASAHKPVPRTRFTERQQSLIGRLVAARLIVSRNGEPESGDVYEIAHAALLENWPRITEWIDADRRFLDWHSQMRSFGTGHLLPESRLAEARGWLAERSSDVDEDVRVLIERSETHYEQQLRELQEARDRAELAARRAESLRLASLSEQATSTRALVAIPLAVESLLRLHTVQGDLALRRALVHAAQPFRLAGHKMAVNAITFSRDGEQIVTGGDDGVTRVFSASGDEISTCRKSGPVKHAAFSDNGEWVISASSNGQAYIIDSSTGELVGSLDHGDAVNFATFSPDGRLVATACDDGVARIFQRSSGAQVGELTHGAPVTAVIFSPDGQLIATASDDGSARLYKLEPGKEQYCFDHSGPVNSVAFSADGNLVATASDDGSVRIFDAASGEELCKVELGCRAMTAVFSHDRELIAMAGGVPSQGLLRVQRVSDGQVIIERRDKAALGCAAFSHDDELIVVAGKSGAVRVFEVLTGTEWTGVGHDGPVTSVDFSPGARKAASAGTDRSARIFGPAPGPERCRITHDQVATHVEFMPGGDQIVSASSDGTIVLSDAATGDLLQRFRHASAVHAVLLSCAGNFVATAGEDGVARVFDISSGVERCHLVHDGPVRSLAVSQDGAWVATGSGDGTARLLHVESGREHLRIPHPGAVTSVDLSWDGRRIATAVGGHSASASAHVFAVDSGAELLASSHPAWVNRAVLSPDGNMLATASDDGTARVFDTGTRELTAQLRHESRVSTVSFSHDGRWVVTASDDGTARVFDPATGAERSRFVHDGWVNLAVFSETGDLVAAASDDGTARVFDLATGVERNRVVHESPVRAVAVSPDGEWLATASTDRSVRVSPIGLQSLLASARTRMTRSLTQNEQLRYGVVPLLDQDDESLAGDEGIPDLPGRGGAGFNWFRRQGYVIVEARGELDVVTCDQLREVLAELTGKGNSRLIMDMREVEFVDSSALHVILSFVVMLKRKNGTFHLVSDRERVNRIFRLTAADRIVTIYASLEDALEADL